MRSWSKNFFVFLFLALSLGCAQNKLVLGPLGPEHTDKPADSFTGCLVVFSAWDGSGTLDPEHVHHSDYDILTLAGLPLKHVKNSTNPMIEDPVSVPLPPGKYLVRARVQGYGKNQFEVTIEKARTTTIYLDDTERENFASASDAQLVRLPDGRIIGWRAAQVN